MLPTSELYWVSSWTAEVSPCGLFNSHWSLSRNARLRTAQEALEFIAAFREG